MDGEAAGPAAAAPAAAAEVAEAPPAEDLPSHHLARRLAASMQRPPLGEEAAPRTPGSSSVEVRLGAGEERLFDTLVAAADMYERGELPVGEGESQGQGQSEGQGAKGVINCGGRIEIRVAGGWVRDKILERSNDDVDVALDGASGVQFASIVQAYLAHLVRTGRMPPPEKRHRIGIITANPSQSKHLETATMKVHGIEVDFVNLRAEEVYEGNSRIPTQQTRQFGTPLEDALRRDFTINSLFYNVRTREVEDYTGRGIDDLLVGRKIVTPLDPNVTFRDDPLRVLRAVRFGVRYGFALSDEVRLAASSPSIHASLGAKVSRERVGKELEGMLTGKGARPGDAFDLIAELGLAGCMFPFPPGNGVRGAVGGVDYPPVTATGGGGKYQEEELARIRGRGWEEARNLVGLLPRALEAARAQELTPAPAPAPAQASGSEPAAAADLRLVHLAAFLLPFRHLVGLDRKNKALPVVTFMVKEGIKFKNKDVQSIQAIVDNVDRLMAILARLRQERVAWRKGSMHIDGDDGSTASAEVSFVPAVSRLEVGLVMRDVKELWVVCCVLATAAEMRAVERSGVDEVLQAARDFYGAVRSECLDGCWLVRPLLNGGEIISSLGLPKGPAVSVYMEEQKRWMLLNPGGAREECERHLLDVKREREMNEGGQI